LGTYCNRNVVPDAFCRFQAALCGDSGSSGSLVAIGRVFTCVYWRESGYLVVAWVKKQFEFNDTKIRYFKVSFLYADLTPEKSIMSIFKDDTTRVAKVNKNRDFLLF
jgi:hypothetical protein